MRFDGEHLAQWNCFDIVTENFIIAKVIKFAKPTKIALETAIKPGTFQHDIHVDCVFITQN